MERIQEMAQSWIIRCGAPEWLKRGLQEYSNKVSFWHRVDKLIYEGVVDEVAVEKVLDEYARHLFMESIE